MANGKGRKDDFGDIWFKPGDNNSEGEKKMPDFQFYDDNRRTFLVIGSIIAVFLFAGILWFLYYQKNVAGPDEVPLIEADARPVKTKPLDPGGMDVPDRDKLIFDKVSGEQTQLTDQVQPAPEQPIGDMEGRSIEDLIRETEPGGTVVAEAEPAKISQTPAPAEGLFIIQLGAFGEQAGAEKAWKILKSRYKAVIGDLTPDIQKATLSEGRVLYRLRAGFFASRAQAEGICNRLKELGQDCLTASR